MKTLAATAQPAQVADGGSVSPRVSLRGLLRAAPRVGALSVQVAIVAFAIGWLAVWLHWSVANGVVGFDFKGTLWEAARAIREGQSPYPPPTVSAVDVGNPALYPPLLMLVLVPLTFVSWTLGMVTWAVALTAGILAALRALNVRDPRCYAIALISAPVAAGVVWGNATLILVPLVALAWRWRDRWLVSGVLLGIAIVSKLFLWPLLLWLLGTRRYRSFAVAIASAIASALGSWLVIGFAGFATYPELLRVAEAVYAGHSYSIATMLSALDVDTTMASRIALVAGGVLAAAAFVAGRRYTDEAAISIAVLGAILGSPIVWEYNYAFLLIPLAIAWPSFSWPWLALPLFYVTHRLPRPHLSAEDLEPGGVACCRPDDIPFPVWIFNHQPPGLWPAAAHALLATSVIAFVLVVVRRQERSDVENPSTAA